MATWWSFFKNRASARKIIVGLGAAVLIVYFSSQYFFAEELKVPDAFKQAREHSEILSANIISLTGQSIKQLDDIAKNDQERKFDKALDLVYQNLEVNRQARQRANDLAVNLEVMAKNLNAISPSAAQHVATTAISAEVALISHLVSYNDYSNQLLESLRLKFLGEQSQIDNQVRDLVIRLGSEIGIINELNQQFKQAIKEFDGYFK